MLETYKKPPKPHYIISEVLGIQEGVTLLCWLLLWTQYVNIGFKNQFFGFFVSWSVIFTKPLYLQKEFYSPQQLIHKNDISEQRKAAIHNTKFIWWYDLKISTNKISKRHRLIKNIGKHLLTFLARMTWKINDSFNEFVEPNFYRNCWFQ